MEEAKKRGLLIGKGGLYGNTLRVSPPLSISMEEADDGCTRLIEAIEAVRETVNHWIGGREHDAPADRLGDVYDPATGERTAQVAFADAAVVDLAVRTAREAYGEWRNSSMTQRVKILFAYRALVEEHLDDIARLISSEHGKVFSDAQGEVNRGLEVVEFACGIPHLLKGEFSENVTREVDSYSIRQPLGVVAGITPFNFPAMVPMWMYPIAVACGNAFILKPSEKDPSAANLMAELFTRAGLPDGVFQVVHGDKVAVDALLTHPEVGAISSVGSTPVAKYIYETAASHGKRVQALGGAKNHMVVLPDADMDLAADAAVSAAYGSTGQRCMAISAVVAVGDAGDALLEGVKRRVEKLKVGRCRRHRCRDGSTRNRRGTRQGRLLHRDGTERGGRARDRRPRPQGRGLRERLLHRPVLLRFGYART